MKITSHSLLQGSVKLRTLLYTQQYLAYIAPIIPLYAIMFGDKAGLSLAQISALFAWWLATMVLAEIPTAIVADRFSRKWSVVAGSAFTGLCYLVWLVAPTFYGFAFGFMLSGIGAAFASGAFQAYVYSELQVHKKSGEYTKVLARSQSMMGLGITTGFLIAAVMGNNYNLALIVSMVSAFVGAAIAACWPEQGRQVHRELVVATHLREALHEAGQSRTVVTYVLAAAVAFGLGSVTEEYLPPFFSELGFSAHAVPLIVAAGIAFGSLIGWYVHHLKPVRFETLCACLAVAGGLTMAATFGNSWVAMICMFLFMRVTKVVSVLFDANLQHSIADARRATVTSLAGFTGEILEVCTFGIVALGAHTLGDFNGYRSLLLAALVFSVGVWLVGRVMRIAVMGHKQA